MTYQNWLEKNTRVQGRKITNLINVQNIQSSLLDNLLDQAGELGEHLSGKKLVTSTVDSRTVIDTVGERLDAQCGIGTQAQSSSRGLSLELQLGEPTSVFARVGLVLLHELLGEVINDNLV